MIKTLTKHGNSMAIVLDKPLLELMGATPETTFKIAIEGKKLTMEPVSKPTPRPDLEPILERAHARYAETFKKLAE